MRKQELLDAIARERARLVAAIDALGEEADTAIVTTEGDGWTAKDVLVHHIHYMEQIAVGLGVEGLQPPQYVIENAGRRPSGEEWNALAVEASRATTLDEVRARFEILADAIVERIRVRSDEELNVVGPVPWSERPLAEFVAGDTVVHWSLHTDEIERAVERR